MNNAIATKHADFLTRLNTIAWPIKCHWAKHFPIQVLIDDDVGMRFEQADNFLRRRHRLVVEYSALGLINDLEQQRSVMLDLLNPALCLIALGCTDLRTNGINGPARLLERGGNAQQ